MLDLIFHPPPAALRTIGVLMLLAWLVVAVWRRRGARGQ